MPRFGQQDIIYLNITSLNGSSITLTVTFPVDILEESRQLNSARRVRFLRMETNDRGEEVKVAVERDIKEIEAHLNCK